MLVKLRGKKGVALIIAFLVMTLLLIYCAAFVSISINQNINADIFKRRTRAFGLAEAGLDQALVWLRARVPPTGNYTNPWGGIQSVGGGTYSVTITDLGPIGGSPVVRRYKTTSTGSFGNMNRVLTNYVQVDNYARYIWFTDSETFSGSTVWFWTADRLNGLTHTNAHFNIYGNPVFAGEASSVDDYIRFYNNGRNVNLSQATNPPNDIPDFQQGIDFGVAEPPDMPTRATNLRSAAADVSGGGLLLQGDTTVVLNSNGTMDLTNSDYCASYTCDDMALPANGALFVVATPCTGRRCRTDGDLTISGTLNGRLSVGAERDVNIPDNVVYADDPRDNPPENPSDDILGIIAERDIVIDDSASTDLEIDGCMMALDSSFYLDNWDSVSPKGNLTVYGGIIQEERGPVGTFNPNPPPNGTKMSGYSKNYSYDSRLINNPPPFMPTTGDYITLGWEEN